MPLTYNEHFCRFVEDIVDRRLAARQEAKPVKPAPVPEPEPAHTGWITDRVPEEGDGEREGGPA